MQRKGESTMMKLALRLLLATSLVANSRVPIHLHAALTTMATAPHGKKSAEEWRAVLSPEQFRVLRQAGTERAGTGEYNKHKEQGVYACAGCRAPLYKSAHKFDSGCGWPAFYDALPGAIARREDNAGGMARTEINCDGHLGHVFKGEGFKNPIDERHCVNSVSLSFEGSE